jgi:hypothetical protein
MTTSGVRQLAVRETLSRSPLVADMPSPVISDSDPDGRSAPSQLMHPHENPNRLGKNISLRRAALQIDPFDVTKLAPVEPGNFEKAMLFVFCSL